MINKYKVIKYCLMDQSSDRCSSISKSTEGRKSSLLDNSESSNGEEAFLNVNEETEEDIAIVPKTAGVV